MNNRREDKIQTAKADIRRELQASPHRIVTKDTGRQSSVRDTSMALKDDEYSNPYI